MNTTEKHSTGEEVFHPNTTEYDSSMGQRGYVFRTFRNGECLERSFLANQRFGQNGYD